MVRATEATGRRARKRERESKEKKAGLSPAAKKKQKELTKRSPLLLLSRASFSCGGNGSLQAPRSCKAERERDKAGAEGVDTHLWEKEKKEKRVFFWRIMKWKKLVESLVKKIFLQKASRGHRSQKKEKRKTERPSFLLSRSLPSHFRLSLAVYPSPFPFLSAALRRESRTERRTNTAKKTNLLFL